jgi:putative FmdB family regulatory protein
MEPGSGGIAPIHWRHAPPTLPRVAPRINLWDHAGAVPTYDYQCRSCGSVTEVIHSMLEDGPSVCERCGGQLRRVLYPTGIIFKGSGFYRTDSRSNSSNASSGNAGSGTKTEKKTDAPAASTASEAGTSKTSDTSSGS